METVYIIIILFLFLIIVLTVGIIVFIDYNKNNAVVINKEIETILCKDDNDYFNYENTDDDIILF